VNNYCPCRWVVLSHTELSNVDDELFTVLFGRRLEHLRDEMIVIENFLSQ